MEQNHSNEIGKPVNKSISVRIIIIGILIIVFSLPFFFLNDLVRERENRRNQVIDEIYSKWANDQTLAGFVMDISFKKILEETYYDEKTKETKKKFREEIEIAHFLPEQLFIKGTIFPEIRYRGIYQAIVYHAELEISGYYLLPDYSKLSFSENNVLRDRTILSFGVSDVRGINKNVNIRWNNEEFLAEPGLKNKDILENGFCKKVSLPQKSNEKIPFNMKLSIRGSRSLNFIPLGKVTHIELNSSWKNPSFKGQFLPKNRSIHADGFEAVWEILDFNRDFPQQWIGKEWEVYKAAFGLELFTPVDEYLKITRSIKYALIFIGLTFLAYFLLIEVFNSQLIHPFQYLMVGFALVMFYLLLLSLSEHLPFNTAYIISTLGVILLTMAYTKGITKKLSLSFLMGGIILFLYGYLFVLLQLEDYSLLIGSLGLFVILALLMYFTRKINWYSSQKNN